MVGCCGILWIPDPPNAFVINFQHWMCHDFCCQWIFGASKKGQIKFLICELSTTYAPQLHMRVENMWHVASQIANCCVWLVLFGLDDKFPTTATPLTCGSSREWRHSNLKSQISGKEGWLELQLKTCQKLKSPNNNAFQSLWLIWNYSSLGTDNCQLPGPQVPLKQHDNNVSATQTSKNPNPTYDGISSSPSCSIFSRDFLTLDCAFGSVVCVMANPVFGTLCHNILLFCIDRKSAISLHPLASGKSYRYLPWEEPLFGHTT